MFINMYLICTTVSDQSMYTTKQTERKVSAWYVFSAGIL